MTIERAQSLTFDHARAAAKLPTKPPFFAAFTLQRAGKTTVYKLGERPSIDDHIIPWAGPLAQAFYEGEVGEAPEFAGDLARLNDTVLADKARLRHTGALLQALEIELPGERQTYLVKGTEVEREGESERTDSTEGLPEIRALLTREQYQLIRSGARQPVIIQGKAGSGKTSVALHRIRWLMSPDTESSVAPVEPGRVLLVMFNKALELFVSRSLQALELGEVRVSTFHGWAKDTLWLTYKGSLSLSTEPGPHDGVAQRLKKHVGMLAALQALVANQAASARVWLAQRLAEVGPSGATWLARWDGSDLPIAARMTALRSEVVAAKVDATVKERARLDFLHSLFEQGVKRLTLYKEDLHKLLSDEVLLGTHLTGVSTEELRQLAEFQRWLGDNGRDSRRPGPNVRFEDLALLLRLVQLKHGGFPRGLQDDEIFLYDHLVIDEAQDFGAVELAVLLAAVRSRTGVTIVGDLNQKIVPEADFIGWEAVAEQLGIEGAKVATLHVGHRSTQPIMDVADALLGEKSSGGRAGPKPLLLRRTDREELFERVALLLSDELAQHPGAHACVVVPRANAVEQVARALSARLPTDAVRVAKGANFSFEPGITVTNLRQIKGLEFDLVVLFDPTDACFPADDDGVRRLYTAVTRARDSLVLAATDPLCALLSPALERGLLELDEDEAPLVFVPTESDEEPF